LSTLAYHWDPGYDTDKAIDEFVTAYYGQAAPYVRKYIDLMHAALEKSGRHLGVFAKFPHQPSDARGRDLGFLKHELLAQAVRLFDQAEEAAWADPVRLHRVQVARLPVIYSRIFLALDPNADPAERPTAEEVTGLVRRFERIARKEGVTSTGAGVSFETWMGFMPRAVANRLGEGAREKEVP
jgi:hypothetical protein